MVPSCLGDCRHGAFLPKRDKKDEKSGVFEAILSRGGFEVSSFVKRFLFESGF